MRKPISFLTGVWLLFSAACIKKDNISGTASLTLFNAIIGSATLVTNFNGTDPIKWYKEASQVIYGDYSFVSDFLNANHFNAYSGKQQISLYEYPDTSSHDNPVISLHLDLPAGSINSLFLSGTSEHPDTLFTHDVLPFHAVADSSMGLRFVNLCAGDLRISVNLQGDANGSQLPELAYRKISGFKNYEATRSKAAYVFEFRDASTGDLITTYTIDVRDQESGTNIVNYMRNRNYTLAIYGEPGNTGYYQPAVQLIRNN